MHRATARDRRAERSACRRWCSATRSRSRRSRSQITRGSEPASPVVVEDQAEIANRKVRRLACRRKWSRVKTHARSVSWTGSWASLRSCARRIDSSHSSGARIAGCRRRCRRRTTDRRRHVVRCVLTDGLECVARKSGTRRRVESLSDRTSERRSHVGSGGSLRVTDETENKR